LHEFIERHAFGLLISQHDGAPFATHLPFLLDRSASLNGVLLGHVAKANPHWQQLADQQALCVFSGPHAYISPSWNQTPNTVPTWNYVAVHVYGRAQLIEDSDQLIDLIHKLTMVYERDRPTPWGFDKCDPFIRKLATGIVGFRIDIERIEGKWKLNQNHPQERRERVIAALRERMAGDDLEIARLMSDL
jgi:transcriptional regulator